MDISFEIIKISPRLEEVIDYGTLVFKVNFPAKVSIDTSRDYWIFLKTIIEGGARKIVVDFRSTEYIDSSGIGVLIRAAKLIKPNNGDLAVSGINNEIKDIFKMINLQNIINIYNSDIEAVNAFRYISG